MDNIDTWHCKVLPMHKIDERSSVERWEVAASQGCLELGQKYEVSCEGLGEEQISEIIAELSSQIAERPARGRKYVDAQQTTAALAQGDLHVTHWLVNRKNKNKEAV